jgi:nitrogen PTS system EIIA component
MQIADLIKPDRVLAALRASDKRNLLTLLSRAAAGALALEPQTVLDALVRREELGSTGVGNGVAMPHARIDDVKAPFCLVARLERPIDFAAIDATPVDLVALVLTPAGADAEHLSALACISRQLRDPKTAERARAAPNAAELCRALAAAPAKS